MNALAHLLQAERVDKEAHQLSEADVAGLRQYIVEGYLPGQFLTAVLENNLERAVQAGDVRNRRRVFEYICWLKNNVPAKAWGSPEKVSAWVAAREKDRYRCE